jgi:hypothetical protein
MELKEARDILGIVNNPVWDFIEPQNHIFTELHTEIGLVNNVLDIFYTFINGRVEALTTEELTSRNAYIVADVSLAVSLQKLKDWKEDSRPQLEFHQLKRIHISQELHKRGLPPPPLVVTDLRS